MKKNNLLSLSERVSIRESILNEVAADLNQGLLNEDTFNMIETILTYSDSYKWHTELMQVCGSYANEIESTLKKFYK